MVERGEESEVTQQYAIHSSSAIAFINRGGRIRAPAQRFMMSRRQSPFVPATPRVRLPRRYKRRARHTTAVSKMQYCARAFVCAAMALSRVNMQEHIYQPLRNCLFFHIYESERGVMFFPRLYNIHLRLGCCISVAV